MQITVNVRKISKTFQGDLTFILNVLSVSSIHFAYFSRVLVETMLLVSHKIVFIENEAALLCVTMRKRAKEFAATIQCITF